MRPIRNFLVPANPAISAPVPLDPYQKGPVSVQLQQILTGAPSITVQWTDDDVFNPAVTPNWKTCGQPAAMVAAGDGGVITDAAAVPKEIMPSAIRFVNSVAASTAYVSIVQSGILG